MLGCCDRVAHGPSVPALCRRASDQLVLASPRGVVMPLGRLEPRQGTLIVVVAADDAHPCRRGPRPALRTSLTVSRAARFGGGRAIRAVLDSGRLGPPRHQLTMLRQRRAPARAGTI